jgi:hypothetical protein
VITSQNGKILYESVRKKRMVEIVWFPGFDSKCHDNMEGLVFMIWSTQDGLSALGGFGLTRQIVLGLGLDYLFKSLKMLRPFSRLWRNP